MNKKRLLIIGAFGLIGKTFIEKYSSKFKIYKCGSRDDLSKILKKSKPDLIFNTSAVIYNEKKMYKSNLLLVKKIIDYLRNNNETKLIHLGSSSEYGRNKIRTTEKTNLKPETAYEATKSAASMLLIGYAKAYALKAIIVRPYFVYGYHSKQNLLIPLIINSIIKNKSLNIYRGYHDSIYVKDFIRGIFILFNKSKLWFPGEIVNMGSGKQISNYTICREIIKIFGNKTGKFKYINKYFKPFDSDNWISNSNYIYKKYKFKTMYNFRSSLIDLKKEYLKKNKNLFN